MRISIINGPNLNMVGERQPEIYGQQSLKDYFDTLRKEFQGMEIREFQTNIEGEVIDLLQQESALSDYILLNAGAYTHTSLAIADAVAAINCPVIEVHISNLASRSDVRHDSLFGKHAIGSICGFGLNSYKLGLLFIQECE